MEKQFSERQTIKVIVFMHGTILPFPTPALIKHAAYTFMQTRDIWKTAEAYYHYLRSNSFYNKQIINDHGLQEIQQKDPVNWLLTSAYRYMHRTFLPDENQQLLFYTFGWSGYLSAQARYRAAEELYDALIKKRNELQHLHPDKIVEFSIVTHSHATNSVLKLPVIEETKNMGLYIDELISFGAPVQHETHNAINHDMFGNIYHFFSEGDFVQICDFVSTRGWSRRRFSTKNPKITQISLDVNGQKPWHASLVFHETRLFEPKLTINPLPLLIFAPWMIAWLKQNEQPAHHLSIRKDRNFVTLFANGIDARHDEVNLESIKASMDVDYAG